MHCTALYFCHFLEQPPSYEWAMWRRQGFYSPARIDEGRQTSCPDRPTDRPLRTREGGRGRKRNAQNSLLIHAPCLRDIHHVRAHGHECGEGAKRFRGSRRAGRRRDVGDQATFIQSCPCHSHVRRIQSKWAPTDIQVGKMFLVALLFGSALVGAGAQQAIGEPKASAAFPPPPRVANLPHFVGFSYSRASPVPRSTSFIYFLKEVNFIHVRVYGSRIAIPACFQDLNVNAQFLPTYGSFRASRGGVYAFTYSFVSRADEMAMWV